MLVPAHLPPVEQFFEEQPAATSAGVAKALGVSTRTVDRWRVTGGSRMAQVALWWLSSHGRQTWDCELHNRFVINQQMTDALLREVRLLKGQIAQLKAEAASSRAETVDLVDQVQLVVRQVA